MRSIALMLVLAGCLLGSAARSRCDAAPDGLRIEAEERAFRSGTATVTIATDGAVRVTWKDPRVGRDRSEVIEFRLSAEGMTQARDAVAASRFFEAWTVGPPMLHGSTWTISVRQGPRELRRAEIRDPPEFEPLGRYLRRFFEQASITAGLRRGDYLAAAAMPSGHFPGVAHLPSVIDELVDCAARQATPTRCAEAAELLFAAADPGDWLRPARDLLAHLDGDRRAAVLVTWTDQLRRPERAGRRATFAPTLLAEAEASAPRWASMSPQEKRAFDGVLSRVLLDGESRAFEVAERMARTTGTPEAPFEPPGLVETGVAAVPIVVRLMDAEGAQARANAVQIAYTQIGVLRVNFGLRERLSDGARAALERRVGEEVVPALERRLRDAAESYSVRARCVTLLDWWDGRCKFAQLLALATEAAANRRERAVRDAASLGPPPSGPLAIAGRLLGEFDTALSRFKLRIVTSDGRLAASVITGSDGSFRAEGLTEGAYDLFETTPNGEDLYLPIAPRAANDVNAGREGVVVRLPGSMIRGRVLDAAGSPIARFPILAQPRGVPGEWPWIYAFRAKTDSEGRFWLVRLPPGVYDLVSEQSELPSLVGGTGIEAGTEERVVHAQVGAPIAGILRDESGTPLANVEIQLLDAGPRWYVQQSSQSADDGSFRFERVDTTRTHRILATVPSRDGVLRGSFMEGVLGGTRDVVLRVSDAPHLRFRVDFGRRGECEHEVRAVRISGEEVFWNTFRGSPIDWQIAPAGRWRVLVRAHDFNAQGVRACRWIEIGTAVTGEPEKTLTVPH